MTFPAIFDVRGLRDLARRAQAGPQGRAGADAGPAARQAPRLSVLAEHGDAAKLPRSIVVKH